MEKDESHRNFATYSCVMIFNYIVIRQLSPHPHRRSTAEKDEGKSQSGDWLISDIY
jgi:hypothetical protein